MAERISSRQLRKKSRDLNDRQAAIKNQEAQGFQGSARNPAADISRANYQTYPYDYYSGADCKVFYGDIWVDDIITIQWNVNQSKTPIYGYASQLFDAIAKGQLLVQGTLSIAFKEVGYLNLIQATMEAQARDAGKIIQNRVDTVRALADNKLAKFEPRLTQLGDDAKAPSFAVNYDSNGNPQIIRNQETIEDILLGKKAGTKVANEIGLQDKNRDFEDFAEVLEDSIWGDSNGNPLTLRNELVRVDEFDYDNLGGIKTAVGENYSDVLNILLTFGDINDYRAEHTLVSLNDVHFVSTGMVVSPTGDPIAETYSFIARDINKAISNEIKATINPIKLDVGNDDLTLSKVEDVATIEEYLARTPNELTVQFEAAFDEFGWSPFGGELIGEFSVNRAEPFIDQIISATERLVNSLDPGLAKIVKTDKQQYIVKVVGAGTGDTDLVMVLEQDVPNTRTYKVIAPTRSGFGSKSIITREDLFSDLGDLPAPLDTVKSAVETREEQIKNRQEALDAEENAFENATTEVGREDELQELQKEQARLAQLKSVPEEERSKFRQRQIRRQQEKVEEAQKAFDEAARFNIPSSDIQGLQDEYRDYANALQADARAAARDGDPENEDLRELITRRRRERAEKKLLEQRELGIDERDLSRDEQEALEARTQQETFLEQQRIELEEDTQRVEGLRNELDQSLSEYERQEQERRQGNQEALAALRQKEQERLQKQREEQARQDEERRKAIEEAERQAAEEHNKRTVEKLREIRAQERAQQQAKVDIAEYNKQKLNERSYGERITSSAYSHQVRPDIHTSGRTYGVALGDLVGVDLANRSINEDGEFEQLGFITNRFEGEILSKGTSSFTIRTEGGQQIKFEHVQSDYLNELEAGATLQRGKRIYYQGDHIQLTTRDYSGKNLEELLRSDGFAYYDTVPTGAVQESSRRSTLPRELLKPGTKEISEGLKDLSGNIWDGVQTAIENTKKNFSN